jgi:undecaprenyl diphosphate synthase
MNIHQSLSKKIPAHVAIIMDGNGRWAEMRNRPRIYGHVRGASRVEPIVREASKLGVKALTLFAFSTENWSRPGFEVDLLWKLMKKFLMRRISELDRNNVRLSLIGEVERIPKEVRDVGEAAERRLARNTGLHLSIAVSYGSRSEILNAVKRFSKDCALGIADSNELDERKFESYLWSSRLGAYSDVDLVIRTSGEKRISNFLLWQSAYAEYVFYDLNWPDFSPAHLSDAIVEYSNRKRRFGGVSETELRMTQNFQHTAQLERVVDFGSKLGLVTTKKDAQIDEQKLPSSL